MSHFGTNYIDNGKFLEYNDKNVPNGDDVMPNDRDTVYRNEYCVNVNNITARFLFSQRTDSEEPNELQEQLIRYNLHTHAHGEMFICYKDSMQINLEHTSACLTAGDILYIPPNTPHVCITPNNINQFIGFGIRLSSKAPSELQRCLTPLTECTQTLILRNQPELADLWRMMFSQFAVASEPPDLLALETLALLTRTVLCGFSLLPLPSSADGSESFENITRIAELEYLIDSRFMTHLTRWEVAGKLFISTRQLDRICQKRFGKSFHDQITERRLSAAVKMLTETALTVDEIGRQVGFPAKSGFYRAFTAMFGMTPFQFRKQYPNHASDISQSLDTTLDSDNTI